jgi:cytidylate kinase
MAIIAMTREMATLGKDVAEGLAARLGLTIVHHELVEQDIAQRAGMPESEVHRFLEGETPLLQKWKIDRKRLSRYTAQEILELAAQGKTLIRGWGATYLLQSVPHAICVRICAPMSFRTHVLMQRLSITDQRIARREIERSDAAHNNTMRKMFGIDWQDPGLYTLALNTARVSVDDCVEQITRLAESPAFQETDLSKLALLDQIILARVHDALDRRFGSGTQALGIEAHVSKGHVTLTGAMSDERPLVECVRLVRDVTGVVSVESKIAYIAFRPPE